MTAPDAQRDRVEELLATRAIEGLDVADEAELDRLLAATDDIDPDRFDEAAAWFLVGSAREALPMPDEVAARVVDRCEREHAGEVVIPIHDQPRPAGNRARAAGWLAAAAALVLAVTGWWPRLQTPAPLDPVEARDRLVATASDLVRVDWSATEHPRAQQLAGGYVVWSDELQRGYMTFRRMPANDPKQHQYQLWVFDASRSKEYPVDGGVFDGRPGDGEVVIPIHTKLRVEQATLFAVTLEPPGGVVVSDRDPILWIAKPEAGTDT